eukprot:1160714-Pelagomonas_calceolata.AAC.26
MHAALLCFPSVEVRAAEKKHRNAPHARPSLHLEHSTDMHIIVPGNRCPLHFSPSSSPVCAEKVHVVVWLGALEVHHKGDGVYILEGLGCKMLGQHGAFGGSL